MLKSSLKNDSLIRALYRQDVDRTPVWIMRQAGRYLPEYRALREKAGSFIALCKTPEWACKATLQPLDRFPLDAAILFSDILTIPDAMGLGLHVVEGRGPYFERPIKSIKDVEALKPIEPFDDLSYVMDSIGLIKKELSHRVPLIGFAGSPWTLACYMIEGGSSQSFSQIKQWLYSDPQSLDQLLLRLTKAVTDYLKAQIKAGVDVVMLFDTWGGILTPSDYQQFSLQPMKQIVSSLKNEVSGVPVILFTKNGGLWLEQIADSNCDAIGIDWTIDIGLARKRVGSRVALQGNMEPAILRASGGRIRQEVKKILCDYGTGPGHVFNLGHGITPDVPPENVSILVEAVHEFSKKSQGLFT